MKKIVSIIMIAILFFTIAISSAVYGVTNLAILTNTDYASGSKKASKDQIITVGSTIQLYTLIIQSGEATGNPLNNVNWESSNAQCASVNKETGLVTGIKEGNATITAQYSDGKASINITVRGTGSGSSEQSGQEDDNTGSGASSGGSSSSGESSSGSSSSESTGGTAVVEEGWTDFSKAKFEVKKDGISGAHLEISGVTPLQPEGYHYYLYIETNNSKPTVDGKKVNGIEYNDSKNREFYTLKYDEDSKVLKTSDIAKYVELNKDYYFAIVEAKDLKESPYIELKVVSYGTKMVRPKENQYVDFFTDSTFLAKDSTQIVTTLTHDQSNDRKLHIKIGKITDNSILQKIKQQDSSGFADLMTFAKNNSAIYDKTVDANNGKNYGSSFASFLEYDTDEDTASRINLTNLEDGQYYFLYVKSEDENGKYNSYEGITLAQAHVSTTSDWWAMFFYGKDDFKWADFGDASLNNGLSKDDPTTSDGKLPQTGVGTGVIASIVAATLLTIISFVVYNKNKDLR